MSLPEPVSTLPRNQARERILAAATRLLREEGAAAVTTRAVAAAAGLNAPTIYRLFDDKNGLLEEVAQDIFATYVASKATDDRRTDPVEDLRRGWDTHIGFGLANPAVFGLLTATPEGKAPSAAAATGVDILRARVERVAAAGRLRVPVGHAVDMIHAAGTGTVLTLLAMPPDERDPALSDAVYTAVIHAITAEATNEPIESAATRAAITLHSDLDGLTELTVGERGLLAELLSRIFLTRGSSAP